MERTRALDSGTRFFLAVPFIRLAEAPSWSKALGFIGAMLSYLVYDLFGGFLLVALIPATLADFYFGTVVAKRRDPSDPRYYDPRRSSAGWNGKLAGLLLLMLVRAVEWWAARHGFLDFLGGDTNGAIATALAVGLFGAELESIEHHRIALGSGPIPGLSHLTALLRRVWVGRIPDPPKENPHASQNP